MYEKGQSLESLAGYQPIESDFLPNTPSYLLDLRMLVERWMDINIVFPRVVSFRVLPSFAARPYAHFAILGTF